ncbi:MAG: ABC transporter permease, partial [Pseudomonadota bacterium]
MLNKKLVRDLWHIRGQVLAIALIIATGTGLLVMSIAMRASLQDSVAVYYERYRFADAFATLKRAPRRVARDINAIAGVQAVQTRIVGQATVGIADVAEPVQAQLVSLSRAGAPGLNQLALQKGRLPRSFASHEAVLASQFAEAHELGPG